MKTDCQKFGGRGVTIVCLVQEKIQSLKFSSLPRYFNDVSMIEYLLLLKVADEILTLRQHVQSFLDQMKILPQDMKPVILLYQCVHDVFCFNKSICYLNNCW